MIPVMARLEYADFDRQVRQPGLAFLRTTLRPTSAQFRKNNFWTRARKHLEAAYSRRCAYTTMRLAEGGTIDHFLPKSHRPDLAYEWSNYRLARQIMNARKGETMDVVDPFQVESGWFVLDIPSCLIRSGIGLDVALRRKVNATINILQLNDDDRMVQERCDWLVDLADGKVTLEFLDKWYPFLSSEVRRQSIEDDLRVIFLRNRTVDGPAE